MSIQGIHGATPSTATLASGSTAAASASRVQRATESPDTATPATGTAQPAPLRFPWLSRLSAQLSAASKTPATFAAPVLGDHLDKQA